MAPNQHPHVHLDEADWDAMAEHNELEGEVLLAFVTDTAAEVLTVRGDGGPVVGRVLDVGSGAGVGTCELARIFPEAEVVAVDSSSGMLERAARRAAALGLDARVRTVHAEVPDGVADLGPADVIWASMSLHHVGDEVAALRALGAALAPGGVLAIAELGDPMQVLPDDLDVGRPGLADRLVEAGAAWFAAMRDGLPDVVPSADLPTMVRAAGLEVVVARHVTEQLGPPLSADGRRLAVEHLRRSNGRLAASLDDDDLRTLDVLTDPDDPRSLHQRPDAVIVASRQIVIARSEGGR
jgi:SAM-dependent methyltransferase